MTKLLEKALQEVSRLPDEQQDALAAMILEELADEKRWADSFARSGDTLARLAQEALTEDQRGSTLPLDKSL